MSGFFNWKTIALCAALPLWLAACSKDVAEETSGGIAEDEASLAAEQEPPGPEAEPAAEEVPVPEDFEQEAEVSINEENYQRELDKLAQEIEQGEGG